MILIDRYAVREAVFLQYSYQTNRDVLRTLLLRGAKVTVFIQDEDAPVQIGSSLQADRNRYPMRNLRSDVGDTLLEPENLKVYKCRTPASVTAIKIDDRVLCMGWYPVEASDHSTAAVIVEQGAGEFQALDTTFSELEKNYRKHSEDMSL